MNPAADNTKATLDEIRKRYRELKRGGNIDPFSLKKHIKSFITLQSQRMKALRT